jgi:enamine deaminase RidA (YjgF/YER057c/UK114 family)
MSHLKILDLGVSKHIGSYSDAIEARGTLRWLFTSGTPGLAADGSLAPDIEGQTRQAWANIFAALEAAGMTPRDLIKVNTTLTREEDIGPYAKIRKELLGDVKPAFMLTVAKQMVKPEFLVEIEIIAATPES